MIEGRHDLAFSVTITFFPLRHFVFAFLFFLKVAFMPGSCLHCFCFSAPLRLFSPNEFIPQKAWHLVVKNLHSLLQDKMREVKTETENSRFRIGW